jgi:hypothetical protein
MADKIYRVSDVIGETLIANRNVDVFLSAQDNANPVKTFNRGAIIGVVYSWLSPSTYRKHFYWSFLTSSGVSYYVRHEKNHLKILGDVLTVKELKELEERQENNDLPFQDKIDELFDSIGVTASRGLKILLIVCMVIAGLAAVTFLLKLLGVINIKVLKNKFSALINKN